MPSIERILVIGQAPGPQTDPDRPFFPSPRTSAGGRLYELSGLSRRAYLAALERVNLLNEFPGRWKRDDRWPVAEARVAASALRPLLAGRSVILVGRKVADAFGAPPVEFHEWFTLQARPACFASKCPGEARVVVIPHPSGRNHWYNRPDNRLLADAFWASLREEIITDKKVLSFRSA